MVDVLFTFRLSKSLKEAFEEYCEEEGKNVSEVLRDLISYEMLRRSLAKEQLRKEREDILKLREKIERGVKE